MCTYAPTLGGFPVISDSISVIRTVINQDHNMGNSFNRFWQCILIFFLLGFMSHGQETLTRKKREIGKEEDPLLLADLFEGDIAGVDAQNLNHALIGTSIWPDHSIPYQIDDHLGFVARRAISKAIAQIESRSCVRFKNATDADQDFIVFILSQGCSSNVGKQGGRQEVSIGDGCEQVGTVLHLLMHVMGFWHEESRLDRDLYVLINWDNIDPDNSKHFGKYSIPRINVQSATDTSKTAYDYESITHISPYAYSKDKTTQTILSKDERFKVGQRLELSQNDVNAIVRVYCGQRQATIANDLMSTQEKELYKKTVEQQTGQTEEEREHKEDEDAPLIDPDQPEGCRDTSRKCPLWATQGLCYKNAQVMATKCPGSCQACQMIAGCDNFNSLCNIWAWLGQCVGDSAQKYLAACPMACGVCAPDGTGPEVTSPMSTSPGQLEVTTVVSMSTVVPVCPDKNRDCQKWASKGRCFYKHVQHLCPGSCNLTCEKTDPGKTPTTKHPPTHKPPRTTKAHVTKGRPTTTQGPCKDTRKNCDRFVPKGYCQRPAFRKGCQLSCNLCGVDTRFHDPALIEDQEENDPNCQDYNHSICDQVREDSNVDSCGVNKYVRHLCPHKCRICQKVSHS